MSQTEPISPLTSLPQTAAQKWQSGALSFVLHVLLLVLATLFFSFQSTPPGGGEPTRFGEIVLAHATENNAEIEYESKETTTPAQNDSQLPPSLPEASAAPADPIAEKKLEGVGPIIDVDQSATQMDRSLKGASTAQPLSAEDLSAIAREQKSLAGRQPPGPLVTTSLFGSGPIEGRRFVFLLDRSASMGERGLGVLPLAEKQLVSAVEALTDTNHFQVLAYHEQAAVIGERTMLAASSDNKRRISEFILDLAAYGSTNHEAGLYSALALRPDVIIWMTDGGYPELNAGQIQAFCSTASKRVAVHAIEFGTRTEQPNNSFMRNLAKASGGSYRYVDVAAWKEQNKEK
ncbi:MAG: hypothetical protein ABL888_10475 [Pirellulaceae bacterium]